MKRRELCGRAETPFTSTRIDLERYLGRLIRERMVWLPRWCRAILWAFRGDRALTYDGR